MKAWGLHLKSNWAFLLLVYTDMLAAEKGMFGFWKVIVSIANGNNQESIDQPLSWTKCIPFVRLSAFTITLRKSNVNSRYVRFEFFVLQ